MVRIAQLFVFVAAMLAATLAWGEPRVTVDAARHVGTWSDTTVRWNSTYNVAHGVPVDAVVEFAKPVPAGTQIEFPHAAYDVLRDSSGRATGFRIAGHPPTRVTMVATTSMESLEPPLVPQVPQRVELVGARVRPGPASPLQLRLTDVRHKSVSREVAHQLDWVFGDPAGSARPVVLIPDSSYFEAGGLTPWVQSDAEAQRVSILTLSGVLALLLALIFGAVRWLRRAARAEEAEAFLADFSEDFDIDASHADALG